MKRLVYAPKAYIFIRSRVDGVVYDVSDYVVSGSVTRNVDQASKAEFVLKNRFFEFSANNRKKPKFLPMDGVTIWLQRIAGRPIQVFTGYLDSVPYYQMYPGNGPFRATCTLKRLANTYFDPSLPATMTFFQRNGWTLAPDGTALNSSLVSQQVGATGNNSSNDSGFGKLLYAFMQDIAGWKASSVTISSLPTSLPTQVAKIYSTLDGAAKIQQDAFEAFLGQLMSLQVDNKVDGLPTLGPPQLGAIKDIKTEGDRAGVSAELLVTAALSFSGLYPFYKGTDVHAQSYGFGLFATPSNQQGTDNGGEQQDNQHLNQYDGYTLAQIFQPKFATRAFIKRLRGAESNANVLRNSDRYTNKAIADLIAKATHKDGAMILAAVNANRETAKSYIASQLYGDKTGAVTAPTLYWKANTASLDTNVTWTTVTDILKSTKYSTSEQAILGNSNYTNLVKNFNRAAAFAWVGLTAYDMRISNFKDGKDWLVMSPGAGSLTTVDITAFSDWVHQQVTTRGNLQVWSRFKDATTSNGYVTRYSTNGKPLSISKSAPPVTPVKVDSTSTAPVDEFVAIRMTDNKDPIDPPIWNGDPLFSNKTPETKPQTDFTFQDLVKTDFSAAFATKFQFPGNFIESQALGGDKSLMNDIPVLEGIRQLCGGSMRSFMSLPTGDFFAFYPDYFGGFGRKPYWSITDLETVNMGINLSDDALATHVFVTGGTNLPNEINLMSNIYSRGVVSIDEIFGADENFISGGLKFFQSTAGSAIPNKGNGKLMNVTEFLKAYGARPKRVENPIIRSHWFEFLYAFQLFMYMWTMQFATTAEFTFQPELMAGGRLAFSDHGIECYLQSVTHSWDYESGFDTTAVLAAPVVADKKDKRWPGMALATGMSGFGAVDTGI